MSDGYRDAYFSAQDGLSLYYRDYGPAAGGGVPVLCLAGLTRNSADFDGLARHLADRRRVVCLDLRGRGKSARDPEPAHYTPPTYLGDVGHLLTVAGLHRVVVVGTSLGGILAMGLGASRPTALAGVVLNDIGPEIDPRGIARIRGYVGEPVAHRSIPEAAETMRQTYGASFPDYDQARWEELTANSFETAADGTLVPNYDPGIATAVRAQGDMDLWPFFRSLRDVPTVSLRGELSDILAPETVARMQAEKPDLVAVTVPNRGHTPDLNEAASRAAIDDLLKRVDADERS